MDTAMGEASAGVTARRDTEAVRKIVSLRSITGALEIIKHIVPDEWRDRPHLYKEKIDEIIKKIKSSSEVDLTELMADLLCLGVSESDLRDVFSRLVPDEYDLIVLAIADARIICIERRESKL